MEFPQYLVTLLNKLEVISERYADTEFYIKNSMDADDVWTMAEGIQTLIAIFRENEFID